VRADTSKYRHVEPDADAALRATYNARAEARINPPVEPLTEADLIAAGLALNLKPMPGEGHAQFRARLRQRWALIQRVMAE
jgi:hypothetical protein